ncbi:MAG: hypothetical protein KC549_05600, partial [Myxococcales bacterium]|nr:hypothetical protein [Myxococcales bacterium]
SAGALYVVANSPDPATSGTFNFHRIYKFAPATLNEDGSMSAGALIGWMGRCTSGSGCNYIDQHSIGFSCTDATCAVEGSFSGSGPGQFNRIAAISIDPNDVLYAADSGNERVQRFTSDGLFAGEARSQSSCPGCTGFVLGDFGSPGNISVNSTNFYIIDIDSELVHVFEASVIHSIDDTSAWVEYQSNPNYVGADFFTFKATDGFRTGDGELIESAPARVDINVSRNFRPPQAQPGLVVTTTEDTPVNFAMLGFDLDGALDTLTYRITQQPGYGVIGEGTGPIRTFTPEADFYGDDSFAFVVNDGREDSEPMIVPVVVEPVNDQPAVSIRTEPLSAGVGFPFGLDALIIDPDWDDEHALLVEWGDGVTESKGQIQEDGSLSGPVVLADTTFTSTVVGYHTYTSPGNKTLRVCAIDAGGLQGCESRTIAVENRVDLALTRQGHAVVGDNQRTLTYALTVENRTPSSGGVAADGVVLRENLGNGASYQSIQPNGNFTCNAGGRSLTCNLGQMAVGSQAQVIVTVAVADSVDVGAEIAAQSSVESSTPDAIADNNELVTQIVLLPQADFYVTSLGEGGDVSPGDGVCAFLGRCSLRAAIEEANATPNGVSPDVIRFTGIPVNGGLAVISLAGDGLPAITDAVVIDGTTAAGEVVLDDLVAVNVPGQDGGDAGGDVPTPDDVGALGEDEVAADGRAAVQIGAQIAGPHRHALDRVVHDQQADVGRRLEEARVGHGGGEGAAHLAHVGEGAERDAHAPDGEGARLGGVDDVDARVGRVQGPRQGAALVVARDDQHLDARLGQAPEGPEGVVDEGVAGIGAVEDVAPVDHDVDARRQSDVGRALVAGLEVRAPAAPLGARAGRQVEAEVGVSEEQGAQHAEQAYSIQTPRARAGQPSSSPSTKGLALPLNCRRTGVPSSGKASRSWLSR